MQLMFASTEGETRDEASRSSAERFFALGAELLGERDPSSMRPSRSCSRRRPRASARWRPPADPPDRVDDVVTAAVRMLLPQIEQQLG